MHTVKQYDRMPNKRNVTKYGPKNKNRNEKQKEKVNKNKIKD